MATNLKLLIVILIFGSSTVLVMDIILNKRKNSEAQNDITTNVRKSMFKVHQFTTAKSNSSQTQTIQSKPRWEIVDKLKKRRDRVRYMCGTGDYAKSRIKTAYKKTISNLIVDTRHGLTWCPIYKAASTMWMKNFAMLSGFSIGKSLNLRNRTRMAYSSVVQQKFQHSMSPNEKLKAINGTTKFLVVRHPFERLLSAYRDKLEHMQGRNFYYMRYGKHIRSRYREMHSNLTSLEPTFSEFLQFIAKERIFDEHWIPFFDSCQPCSIDYDYIFKFEHLEDEYNVFVGDKNLVDYFDYAKSDARNTSSREKTNYLVSERYFQNVTESLLSSIFKIYEIDFLLFSYSPAKYYYMSNNSL